MDPITIGALIAGGTALLGGAIGSSDKKVAEGHAQDHAANQQRMQMILAEHGVTMRAKDIMNAYNQTGIHPLAMLGVQGPTYTPTNYVGSGGSPMGDAVTGAGQNIGRAMMATKTIDERDRLYVDASRELQLKKGTLELELLASQIRRMNMIGPGMPSVENPMSMPGQGNSPGVNTTGLIRDSFDAQGKIAAPGRLGEMDYVITPRGGHIPVPQKETKERIEDDFWAQTGFFVRNNLVPQFDPGSYNPPGEAPRGFRWTYDMVNGYRLERAPAWHGRGHPSERR